MRTFSCGFSTLYAQGGWYEPDEAARESLLDASAATWISNVYPPYRYDRPLPAALASAHADTEAAVFKQYREWNERYARGASTDLFVIESAVLFDRTLYAPLDGEWAAVYETNRSFERGFKTQAFTPEVLHDALRPHHHEADYFYFGTVGSENYAHWIVDDLTRAKALLDLGRDRDTVVLLDRYFHQIDQARVDSLRLLLGNNSRVTIIFIDKARPYFFERIFYVSPSTYHPFLKCPDALEYLHTQLRSQASSSPKRLLVGRKALWRNLLNVEEVARALEHLDFTAVTLEDMTFAAQVELFSNADVIVGVSGAAMVNTLFAPPGALVVYLAGEGFIDPFYWDLAALRRHEYRVCFGVPWKPEMPIFSSFTLGRDQIDELESWIRAR